MMGGIRVEAEPDSQPCPDFSQAGEAAQGCMFQSLAEILCQICWSSEERAGNAAAVYREVRAKRCAG